MLRREIIRGGLSAGLLAVSGCIGGSDTPAFQEGFEDGLGEWTTGAAIGREVELQEFDWEVGISRKEAAEGEQSLRIWNEGDHDDGVTWVVHPVAVDPGQSYDVTVTAQFWSESESFNVLRDTVMRLGPEPPEVEEDFPDPGVNTTAFGETPYGGLREPLWQTAGWKEYSFTWTTPTLSTDTLSLAVGTSVVWESDIAHFVDDITVEFETR